MATPPRSPKIIDQVLRIYEERHVTLPLLAALSKLQKQLEATGNTEVPFKRVPYSKTPELSWGRQSPQLTPTPSPSPPSKTLYANVPRFPTPPDMSPLRERVASASCPTPTAKTTSTTPYADLEKPATAISYDASALTSAQRPSPGTALLGAGCVGAKS